MATMTGTTTLPSPPPACPFAVRAVFPFFAENEAEMSLSVNDEITVVSTEDPGWWEGTNKVGQRGLFPSNYVALSAASPTKTTYTYSTQASKSSATPLSPSATSSTATLNSYPSSSMSTVFKPQHNATVSTAVTGLQQKTFFGHWSYNMALMTGVVNVLCGIMGVVWHQVDPATHNLLTQIVGIYTILISLAFLTAEYTRGLYRSYVIYPIRGALYIGSSIFMFFAIPTILAGAFTCTVGVVNIISCALRESYEPPPHRSAHKEPSVLEKSSSFWDGLKQYYAYLYQQNLLGHLFFICLYIAGNIAIFVYQVVNWFALNNAKAPSQQLSNWAPWAKGFGGMLDLNCALILMPVLRTLLRYLYNASTKDQGIISRTLRWLLWAVPLDSNLLFHKLVAKVIMFSTFGHVILHLINASVKYSITMASFGASPWWTGGVVSWAMLVIYSAVPANVKNGQFEIFWYSHHCFIIFFIVLLTHGHGGLNPNYWKFFILPGSLYLLERSLRYYRAKKPVAVLGVTMMQDVFSLSFDKIGVFAEAYSEGQYIFLNCPAISRFEWHPFTISSAPQEKFVSVHIRVLCEGTWTRRVSQYIGSMGPKLKPYFELDRQGPNGKIAGKVLGPDGKAMLCIDGPHSAPTQHIGEYSTAMVIGAGIGATPVSSALLSTVFHKWKFFIGQCFPDSAYFYWVCAHKDIDAFRWLIRRFKEAQEEVNHMRHTNAGNMSSKNFGVHIFITSPPKQNSQTAAELKRSTDSVEFWGLPADQNHLQKSKMKWDEGDLYVAMKTAQKPVNFDDIYIWQGRPNWRARFEEISNKHHKENIGVLFCGNEMIAKDLKRHCHSMNTTRSKAQPPIPGLFKLHKENF